MESAERFLPTHIVSAGAIVLNDRDEVLLVKDVRKDVWTFPGGIIEEGEGVLDGVKREVLEETGIQVEVGGAVIKVEGDRGDLELLFVSPKVHSRGIGYAAWCAIEQLHPEVTIWETVTPYFEQRNIHFYVNRCGFHIVEFFNAHHPDPHDPEDGATLDDQFPTGMFRFEKRMR